MPIDPELLAILVCPAARQPVGAADEDLLARLNGEIARGGVTNLGGQTVSAPVAEGLVREDGRILYPIRDGIPIMLIDESIDVGALFADRRCSPA